MAYPSDHASYLFCKYLEDRERFTKAERECTEAEARARELRTRASDLSRAAEESWRELEIHLGRRSEEDQ